MKTSVKNKDLTVLEFQRAGEITVAEVEDVTKLVQLEKIEFLNMLSNEGDDLSAVLRLLQVQEEQKVVIRLKC